MGKDNLRKRMVVLAFLATLSALGSFFTSVEICQAKSAQVDAEMMPVRIGFEAEIFGRVDQKDAQAIIDLYIKEFARALQINAEAVIYPNIELIISDLIANRLDLVCSSVANYYRISKKVDTELAYTNTNSGRKTRRSILLIHRDSSINGIEDLKGRSLLMNSSDDIGRIFINTLLLRNNESPADQYFSKIIYKPRPSKMILDVFFKKSEACLIDDWTFSAMSELNPQIQNQLKIVARSPFIIPSVTFFRKNFVEKLKNDMTDIAVKTAKSTYGQQLLVLFKSDNIAKLKPSDLDSFEQLWDEYEERMQNWKGQMNAQ